MACYRVSFSFSVPRDKNEGKFSVYLFCTYMVILTLITGEWRKLQNEGHTDLYSSPNTIRVIKSRRMRWAGHVARMGERRGAYRILVEHLRERDNLEVPGEDNIQKDLQEVGWGHGLD